MLKAFSKNAWHFFRSFDEVLSYIEDELGGDIKTIVEEEMEELQFQVDELSDKGE